VEILRPLPTSGQFVTKSKIIGFYDKGKGKTSKNCLFHLLTFKSNRLQKGALMVQEAVFVDPKSGVEYVRYFLRFCFVIFLVDFYICLNL
jgi:hypothetical protein